MCLESLLEASFEVVDVEVVVAMEADEVVLIAFVVAHEDVLAVDRAVVFPPPLSLLDGFAFGVVVAGEGYVVLPEIVENFVLSFCGHGVDVVRRS